MKTFADLLYEAADLMHTQAGVFRANGMPAAGAQLDEQAEEIRQALRTPNGDVLTPEQIARITKNYDASGWAYRDISKLVESHEAMRRALNTNASICERYASRWSACFPGMVVGTRWIKEPCWSKVKVSLSDYFDFEPMTADEISWFETHRKENSDVVGS